MSASRRRVSSEVRASNRRTIASYERYARDYARLVAPVPSPADEAALRRLAAAVPGGARILEIGSGPGREADFLESLGLRVRRTDATRAFLALQARRGKRGTLLNVLTDRLGGPYDGILAMCVLIHVDRDHTDLVLRKIARALRRRGVFLVSVRRGRGETTGDYHTIYWQRPAFAARLEAAGLRVTWQARSVDSDGDPWLTFLAVKS
ncbi:MAG: methyltransferase [Vicinamibacteraceae bacterium]